MSNFDLLLARQQAVTAFEKMVLDKIRADSSPEASGLDRLLDAAFRQVPAKPLPDRPRGAPPFLGLGFGQELRSNISTYRGAASSKSYQAKAANVAALPGQKLTPEYSRIMSFVLKWEGSKFTNDPLDRGGPTRYGVIQVRYDQFRASNKLPLQSVKFISRTEVDSIYADYYWQPVKGWLFHPKVGATLMDFGVNSGPSRSIKYLQWALGRTQTGKLSDQDIAAANQLDPLKLALKLIGMRESFLKGIVRGNPKQVRFLDGWLNRTRDLKQLVKTL